MTSSKLTLRSLITEDTLMKIDQVMYRPHFTRDVAGSITGVRVYAVESGKRLEGFPPNQEVVIQDNKSVTIQDVCGNKYDAFFYKIEPFDVTTTQTYRFQLAPQIISIEALNPEQAQELLKEHLKQHAESIKTVEIESARPRAGEITKGCLYQKKGQESPLYRVEEITQFRTSDGDYPVVIYREDVKNNPRFFAQDPHHFAYEYTLVPGSFTPA